MKSPSRIAQHTAHMINSDPIAAAMIKDIVRPSELIDLLGLQTYIDDLYGIPSTATLDDAFDQGYTQAQADLNLG